MNDADFRKNVVEGLAAIFEQFERSNDLREREIALLEETNAIVKRNAALIQQQQASR
jgi:hypothetical protein